MAIALSLGILAFGGVLVTFQMSVMIVQRRYWDDQSLKIVGLTIIVTAGLMLISAGYSQDQAAPMMGLLGTVAGYLLGKGGTGETVETSEVGEAFVTEEAA